MQNRYNGLIFTLSSIFLLSAVVVFLAAVFLAPLEFIVQQGPKLVAGLTTFCVTTFVGIFVDSAGFRLPSSRDLMRKTPVVAGGTVVTLVAVLWLTQASTLQATLARYNEACKVAGSSSFGDEVAKAQRTALDAQADINGIVLVRHPKMEGYPCV